MSLADIGVQVMGQMESPTGMAQALLSELHDHLKTLSEQGASNSIDLRSLPMNQADREQLADFLGRGEVEIRLNTIGHSLIYETSYTGIWWITHYGDDENIVSELIEITRIPEIVISHPDDIATASQRMAEQETTSFINQDEKE